MRGIDLPVLNEPAAIVARAEAAAEQAWQEIVDRIAALKIDEDQTALEMGDLFVRVVERFGKRNLRVAAEQAAVSYSVARQRYWVSSRIPSGSRLRQMQLLTYTHLRLLAGIDDEAERELWAQRTIENQWSVAELREQLDRSETDRAVSEGRVCIQCQGTLPERADRIVSFRIGSRGALAYCCNAHCAAEYFADLSEQEVDDDDAAPDPFSSTSSDADDAPLLE